MRHAARHLHAGARHVGEAVGVVRRGVDRLGQVFADLVAVDVECRDEVDVADVIPAQVDVHDPWDPVAWLRVAVVMDALHEGARAVAHADDRRADPAFAGTPRGGSLSLGGGRHRRAIYLPLVESWRPTWTTRTRSVTDESSATIRTAALKTSWRSNSAHAARPSRKMTIRASRGAGPTLAFTPIDSAFARTYGTRNDVVSAISAHHMSAACPVVAANSTVPMKSAASESRSTVESRNAPNAVPPPAAFAT